MKNRSIANIYTELFETSTNQRTKKSNQNPISFDSLASSHFGRSSFVLYSVGLHHAVNTLCPKKSPLNILQQQPQTILSNIKYKR